MNLDLYNLDYQEKHYQESLLLFYHFQNVFYPLKRAFLSIVVFEWWLGPRL